MRYKDGDIVTTRDGRKHRVLWPTKTDAEGNHMELRVKSVTDKHRKGYMLATDKIVESDEWNR